MSPSYFPSKDPSQSPTNDPSQTPSMEPSQPTQFPSSEPTSEPSTTIPSSGPTSQPTFEPSSAIPTSGPTSNPSISLEPTVEPSSYPTYQLNSWSDLTPQTPSFTYSPRCEHTLTINGNSTGLYVIGGRSLVDVSTTALSDVWILDIMSSKISLLDSSMLINRLID